MFIEAGYNIAFECTSETPLLLMVHIRPERRTDLTAPESFTLWPDIPYRTYTDHFGNICTRLTAPVGPLSLTAASPKSCRRAQVSTRSMNCPTMS